VILRCCCIKFTVELNHMPQAERLSFVASRWNETRGTPAALVYEERARSTKYKKWSETENDEAIEEVRSERTSRLQKKLLKLVNLSPKLTTGFLV